MPLFDLQLKASLEGVDEIKPQDDYRLMAKVVCTKCHEEHPKPVALVPGEEHEVHGAKNASAHLVIRCQMCKTESWARFAEASTDEKKTSKKGASIYHPYTQGDGGATWQTLTKLECRGIEPVAWVYDGQSYFIATSSESGSTFDEVEFDENMWMDYDEKAGNEVSVQELESRWVRA